MFEKFKNLLIEIHLKKILYIFFLSILSTFIISNYYYGGYRVEYGQNVGELKLYPPFSYDIILADNVIKKITDLLFLEGSHRTIYRSLLGIILFSFLKVIFKNLTFSFIKRDTEEININLNLKSQYNNFINKIKIYRNKISVSSLKIKSKELLEKIIFVLKFLTFAFLGAAIFHLFYNEFIQNLFPKSNNIIPFYLRSVGSILLFSFLFNYKIKVKFKNQ